MTTGYEAITEGEWKDLATTEITHLTDEEKDYLPRAWDEWIARVRRDAGRAAMLKFVEEAEKYRDLRDASDDRHSAQDVDGWWYVISAADEHIAEFHPDPEETP